MNRFQTIVIALIAALPIALPVIAQQAGAPAETPVKLNISAQPLADALAAFAQQTGLQLIVSSEVAKNLKSAPLAGTYTPEAALEQLLANSDLRYRFVNARTIAIQSAKPGDSGVSRKISDVANSQDAALLLVQAQVPAETSAAADAKSNKVPASDEVEEMLVEGEREKPAPFSTANIDLTRTREDPLPFTTFSARDIELSGAADLDEFLRNRLTQADSRIIDSEQNREGSVLLPVDFRGWGSAETLILVNGRRVPSKYLNAGSSDTRVSSDLSGIPLGAIERVEILPSAGGALYGTNATAGIINVITRQDYSGGQLAVGFGNPFKGDAPKRSADLVYARDLGRGYSLRLTAGYSDSNALKVEDRADVTVIRKRQAFATYYPVNQLDLFNYLLGVGSTTNIFGLDLFGPDTGLSVTSVPPGYTGGQGLAPFLSRNGVLNLELADGGNDTSYYGSKRGKFGADTDKRTFTVGLEKYLAAGWNLAFEYQRSRQRATSDTDYFSNGGVSIFVPAGAQNSPFGPDALMIVKFDDPRLDPPGSTYESITTDERAGLTLRGQYRDWRVLADFQHTSSAFRSDMLAWDSPLGGEGLAAAILSGAYNPFVDMRVTPAASPEFYREAVWKSSKIRSPSEDNYFTSKASGPIWNLPAGSIQTTFVAEWSKRRRKQSSQEDLYFNSLTGAPTVGTGSDLLTQPRNVPFTAEDIAVAGEATVPVLSREMAIPLAHKMELFASGRIAEQTVKSARADGTPFSHENRPYLYSLGLRHDFFPGIALRASESIGFKPATFSQLMPNVQDDFSTTVTDLRRNNQTVSLTPAMKLTGGNPDLKPETTVADSIGLIFQPSFIKGLWLSFDYVRSTRDDAISALSLQDALDLEADIPERVQRAAPEPGAPNGVGAIVFVDSTNVNFAQIKSEGFDATLEQAFENIIGGRLILTAAATRNASFLRQATAKSLSVEQVRNPEQANITEWRANGQVRWESRRRTLGWNVRYFDDVLFRTDDRTPVNIMVLGQNLAKDAFEHDVFASFRFGPGGAQNNLGKFLNGTSLTFGIKNAFDRKPRFDALSNLGYVGADSYVGRSFWMQLRKDL